MKSLLFPISVMSSVRVTIMRHIYDVGGISLHVTKEKTYLYFSVAIIDSSRTEINTGGCLGSSKLSFSILSWNYFVFLVGLPPLRCCRCADVLV